MCNQPKQLLRILHIFVAYLTIGDLQISNLAASPLPTFCAKLFQPGASEELAKGGMDSV